MNHERSFKMTRLTLQVLLTLSAMMLIASVAMAGQTSFTDNTYTPAGTSISNQATVNYNNANGVAQSAVNSNTVTTTVTQVYGVTVVPGTDAKPGVDGTSVIYTVTVYNNGNGPDTFALTSNNTNTASWTPSSVQFSTQSNGSGATNTLTTGSVNQNASTTVYMVVSIPAGAPSGTTEVTNAVATCKGGAGASDTDIATTTANADNLSTSTKTASTATPSIGVPFTYTIAVPNTGNIAATGVTVTDALPAGVTYVAGTIYLNGTNVPDTTAETPWGGGSTTAYAGGTITIDAGTLGAGATDTLTFQATANANTQGSPITNTANIQFDTSSKVSPFVAVTPALAAPALSLSKVVDKASAAPGATLTYTITATNSASAGPADGVVISDPVPANTTYVTGSAEAGPSGSLSTGNASYNSGTNTVSTTAATIAPGGTLILEFQVQIK